MKISFHLTALSAVEKCRRNEIDGMKMCLTVLCNDKNKRPSNR
jgi:hypothetical protein